MSDTDDRIRRAAGNRGMTSSVGPQNAADEAWFRGRLDRATGRAQAIPPESSDDPKPRGDGGGGPRGQDPPGRFDANAWLHERFHRSREGFG